MTAVSLVLLGDSSSARHHSAIGLDRLGPFYSVDNGTSRRHTRRGSRGDPCIKVRTGVSLTFIHQDGMCSFVRTSERDMQIIKQERLTTRNFGLSVKNQEL
jgi:hypothetical protein